MVMEPVGAIHVGFVLDTDPVTLSNYNRHKYYNNCKLLLKLTCTNSGYEAVSAALKIDHLARVVS